MIFEFFWGHDTNDFENNFCSSKWCATFNVFCTFQSADDKWCFRTNSDVENAFVEWTNNFFSLSCAFWEDTDGRLILLVHTTSESTIVKCLIPERTKLSAHHEPTPPTPKTITRFSAMRLMASAPNRSSDLWNISCSSIMSDLNYTCSATTSISTKAPLGRVFTATAERAG